MHKTKDSLTKYNPLVASSYVSVYMMQVCWAEKLQFRILAMFCYTIEEFHFAMQASQQWVWDIALLLMFEPYGPFLFQFIISARLSSLPWKNCSCKMLAINWLIIGFIYNKPKDCSSTLPICPISRRAIQFCRLFLKSIPFRSQASWSLWS